MNDLGLFANMNRLIRKYREAMQLKWRKSLTEKNIILIKKGKIPFENGWYSENEVELLERRRKKKEWASIFDLTLVFLGGCVLTMLLYAIIFLVIDAP